MRHSGFIPWDDDIDLGMMRPDYDRFCAIAPQALPDDLCLIIPGKEKHYSPMFAKVMKRGTKFWAKETVEAGLGLGIFIDIFPYDDLSPDEATAKKQVGVCTRWQRISYLYHAPSVVLPHKGILPQHRKSCFCRTCMPPCSLTPRFWPLTITKAVHPIT